MVSKKKKKNDDAERPGQRRKRAERRRKTLSLLILSSHLVRDNMRPLSCSARALSAALADAAGTFGSHARGVTAAASSEAKPSSALARDANAPKKTQDQHQHHPHHPVVKLSRPPLPFLFALFLNQFYINLIVLVPRQVGIYIIRQRFLPQDDPAAQLTGE